MTAANALSLIGIGLHVESVWRSLAACPQADLHTEIVAAAAKRGWL